MSKLAEKYKLAKNSKLAKKCKFAKKQPKYFQGDKFQ